MLLNTASAIASAQEEPKILDGIRFRDSTDYISTSSKLRYMSFMGGAELVVDGSHMSEVTDANVVKFHSDWPAEDSTFYGPGLSSDDQFSSATAAGILAWTVPSAGELAIQHPLGGASLPDRPFTLSVYNAIDDHEMVTASGNQNTFVYRREKTPLLYDMIPSQTYPNQMIQYMVNPMSALSDGHMQSGERPVSALTLDGEHTNWKDTVPENYKPAGWQFRDPLTAYVSEDQTPSANVKPRAQFRVGDVMPFSTSKHCNFDGDDCWSVRVHPVIDSLESSEGYTTGGQDLKIFGQFGLSGDAEVNVDGVKCDVTSRSDSEITCTTGAAVTSIQGPQPGQLGLIQKINGNEQLLTSFETYVNQHHNKHIYTNGYFKAPATGSYKFHISSDDNSRLYLDENAYDKTSPQEPDFGPEKANRGYNCAWRDFFAEMPSTMPTATEWIDLEEGQFYPISGYLREGNGQDHFSVAVEYEIPEDEAESFEDHPHMSKEMQLLSLDHTGDLEMWQLVIEQEAQGDDGTFELSFLNPKQGGKYWISDVIQVDASDDEIRNKVNPYFGGIWSTYVSVSSSIEEVEEQEDELSAPVLVKTIRTYNVTLNEPIDADFSFELSTIYKNITNMLPTTNITINKPTDVRRSSPPLSKDDGRYTIMCAHPLDPENPDRNSTTVPIPIGASANDIEYYLIQAMPYLAFKTRVTKPRTGYASQENGIKILITFRDFKDMPQCYIQSAEGDHEIVEGAKPVFDSVTFREYGKSLWFEPVPLEMLYTPAEVPQVTVRVNGLPAVCPKNNCGYSYIEAGEQSITQISLSGTDLTIEGSDFNQQQSCNSGASADLSVEFANTKCGVTSSDLEMNKIDCTLPNSPAAGTHHAKIHGKCGYFIESSTPIDIELVISDVTSSSGIAGLNKLGGDTLTITGTGFPLDKEPVVYFDHDGSVCKVISFTETEIKCIAQRFDQFNLDEDEQDVVVMVNDKTTTYSTSLIFAESIVYAESIITSQSLSPVLRNDIVIQLSADYPVDPELKREDFVAELNLESEITQGHWWFDFDLGDFKWIPDETTAWPLYVRSVDTTERQVTLNFRGAPTGDYAILISSQSHGRLDNENLKIKTEAFVTGFSPSSGSALGGTLVTITGENFSEKTIDNPVMIGDALCIVKSSKPTEIICEIEERPITEDFSKYPMEGQVSVFLALSETARCDIPCVFTFEEPNATVTGFMTVYDQELYGKENVVIVEGSGFLPSERRMLVATQNDRLVIDGVELTNLISLTDNEAVFSTAGVLDFQSNDMKIIFAEGLPKGYSESLQASLELKQTPYQISPNTGAVGGTKITVSMTGVGAESDLEGATVQADLNGEWTDICEDVTLVGYGTLSCTTFPVEVADSLIRVNIPNGDSPRSCENFDDSALCMYKQEVTASTATVTKATVTGTGLASKIEFEGTNFDSFGLPMLPYGVYRGVRADTLEASDISPTKIIVTFTKGVPAPISLDDEERPMLVFENKDSGAELTAAFAELFEFIGAPVLVIDEVETPASVKCSFAGCDYTLTAPGLGAILAGTEDSKIEVCGNPCVFDAEKSDALLAVCNLPPMITQESVQEYELAEPAVLKGAWVDGSGSEEQLAKLNDGINTVDYQDSSNTCFFEFESAREGYMYAIKEVRFFINGFDSSMEHVNNLKFQGYQDDDWVDIWQVDSGIHKGWNSKDIDHVVKKFRFTGQTRYACRVGEVQVKGIEVFDAAGPSVTCSPTLTIGADKLDIPSEVVYSADTTPVLTSMSKRFGTVLGGDVIEFTGTNLQAPASPLRFLTTGDMTAVVKIDNRDCEVTAQSQTTITCTTDKKPDSDEDPSLQITVEGMGNVATMGKIFRYVKRWSDTITWGGLPPSDGDAVSVPKGMHLLVDIPKTPKLSFVNVEGSLIFDQDKASEFDAEYIIAKGGYIEIGTEDEPYLGQLTITMHGREFGTTLPLFGNKVLAVKSPGQLEMHGKPRDITWTDLKKTVSEGGTSIEINDVPSDKVFDWAAGEEIVIASTDFEGRHAEQRSIVSVSGTTLNPILELDAPLEFQHYAGKETHGDHVLEVRAEVGLLSRNVVFRGDPETSSKMQYGAHIMLADGQSGVSGRIENIELTDVGQAFKLGRYPIHFHLAGNVNGSYIKNNAIHNSFNRGVTLHGVQHLTLENNVIYKEMGHGIFIEDGVETNNRIIRNLVVDTRRSNSLLVTDTTPASFWIQHPDNIFIGNHAAGSDRYGYWFDLPEHPTGPSLDKNICPINAKLGEFRDNVSHSNGRYGLRLFHGLFPKTFPCQGLDYESNPPVPAKFENHLSYKNKRNGMISEDIGAVQFHNFITADNILAGMEVSLTGNIKDGLAKIVGGLVVGRSGNTEPALESKNPHGIITPRTENFTIHGTKFVNFNRDGGVFGAALGTCSHCFHGAATDSGARTVTLENLVFEGVTKRIRYQYPFRAIFHDKTGSLTGVEGGWATAHWKHLEQPECQVVDAFDGIICDSSVQVRRVAFHGYKPSNIFRGMDLRIAKYDEQFDWDYESQKAYLDDKDNYGLVPFKAKLDPTNGHAIPFVTGHTYHIHWNRGLDFTRLLIEVSERWQPEDKSIFFNTNYTDFREGMNITTGYGSGYQIHEGGLRKDGMLDLDFDDATLESGENAFNGTYPGGDYGREFNFVINGKNPERNKLRIQGLRCIEGTCPVPKLIDGLLLEEEYRLWSNPLSWEGAGIPKAGDDVHIAPTWNMLLDIADPPEFNNVMINGRLTFADDAGDVTFKAHSIWVQQGQFYIGTKEKPFTNKANIVLAGMQDDPTLVISGGIEAGNKVLVNSGKVKWFGADRNNTSRLRGAVTPTQKTAKVDIGLDWQTGDELYFAPTTMHEDHSDYRTIVSYDDTTGQLELNENFSHYHWGEDSAPTPQEFGGLDMRGEVILLTRNIKIQGEDTDGWGGNILTAELRDPNDSKRFLAGQMQWNNVEVYNCSQQNTEHAAVRFEGAITGPSAIENSVVHGSLAWSLLVTSSNNISIKDSAFVGSRAVGVNLNSVTNVHLDGCFVGDVVERPEFSGLDGQVDKEACYAFCSYNEPNTCYESSITNSIAAGCKYGGFVAPGHACGESETSTKFRGNVAHSVKGAGAYVYPDNADSNSRECYEGSHFSAYKNKENGLVANYVTKQVRMRDMVFVDNKYGLNLNANGETNEQVVKASFIKIYGESHADDCATHGDCFCSDKMGLMMFGAQQGGKPLHPLKKSSLPIFKLKSYATFDSKVEIDNVEFHDFAGSTRCGRRQHVFERNPSASDGIPLHTFDNIKFVNVTDDALVWIEKPNPGWANPTDCGDWPCTAPSNVVMKFKASSYESNDPETGLTEEADFEIVSDNRPSAGVWGECVEKTKWSAYRCKGADTNLGILLFESLDADKEDRLVSPVFVQAPETGFLNKLNAMMDHGWDGFYTSQKRLARFPAMLETGVDHTVRFQGTPPKEMRFGLRAAGENQAGVKVKIPYPNTGVYEVKANGAKVPPMPFNDTLGYPEQLPKSTCGENRFQNLANWLEFYITPGCEILIKPLDSIIGSVRMDWTMDEFWNQEGTTSFEQRIASVLGVHWSRVHTIQVYPGSVVVKWALTEHTEESIQEIIDETPEDEEVVIPPADKTVLAELLHEATSNQDTVEQMFPEDVPVMGIEEDGELIQGDPIPPPPDAEWDYDLFGSLSYSDEKELIEGTDQKDSLRPKDRNKEYSIVGDDGNDTIYGGHKDDDLLGNDGNDRIQGGNGNDRLSGGKGDDSISGGNGNDLIHGGSGDDKLRGHNHDDVLSGYSGEDYLDGGSGDDILSGGFDDDVIKGGSGHDTLNGDQGHDEMLGESGQDVMKGGDGNDKMKGMSGHDEMYGDDGEDDMNGGSGDDTMYGGLKNDKMRGGHGHDTMEGGLDDDDMDGQGGNDIVDGGAGNDIIKGDAGHDKLYGGLGDDYLEGGNGNDLLEGGEGNDKLAGGSGNDHLIDTEGDNEFWDNGSYGMNIFEGGSGADKYFIKPGYSSGSKVQIITLTDNDTINFKSRSSCKNWTILNATDDILPEMEKHGEDLDSGPWTVTIERKGRRGQIGKVCNIENICVLVELPTRAC